jgi:hypothetical protein
MGAEVALGRGNVHCLLATSLHHAYSRALGGSAEGTSVPSE